MLTWHQANSYPFFAKKLLKNSSKNSIFKKQTLAGPLQPAGQMLAGPLQPTGQTLAGPLQPAFAFRITKMKVFDGTKSFGSVN
jgi:hypothetical protein